MKPTRALLVLTAVGVSLEMSLLVSTLAGRRGPMTTGLLLAAFHAGYLVADRAAARRPVLLAQVGALGMSLVGVCLANEPLVGVPAAFLASGAIQGLRRQRKAQSSVAVGRKNAVKFSAMAVGGLAMSAAGLSLLMAASVVGVVLGASGSESRQAGPVDTARLPRQLERWLLITEFQHHSHYFCYAYTFWRIMNGVPPVAVGLLFALGWLAYFAAEITIGSRRSFSPSVVAAGHLLVAASLLGMLASSQPAWVMLMWFLTGVGGGTAYMLGQGPQARNRERAEDSGHVAGTVVGAVVAAAVSVEASLGAGLAAACTVAGAALLVHLQLRRKVRT